MKTNALTLVGASCLFFTPLLSQLVVNDNAFVLISNTAKVVLTDPSPSGVIVQGAGANIVSEGQQNQVIWPIRNSTGTYVMPWTTRPTVQGGTGVKIPLTVQLTIAGSSDGIFEFSTYETATDNNTPYPTYPTAITSMNSPAIGNADGSLYVVDRFWIMNNQSYTTKPAASLIFRYDDSPNEIAGSNLLVEANLRAQRWNITANSWETLLYGTTNTITNTTSGVTIGPADFWPVWILVDFNVPLPVEMKSFEGRGAYCSNILSWSTASETNNKKFVIERSIDANSWTPIGEVFGAGTSSSLNHYSFTDNQPGSADVNYYRIVQVDFDGKTQTYGPIAISTTCDKGMNFSVYPNPAINFVMLSGEEDFQLRVFDATGHLVLDRDFVGGVHQLSIEQFSRGVYTFELMNQHERTSIRIIKND